MKPLQHHAYEPVEDQTRDCCEPLAEDETTKPTIVNISDIHGYLKRARSALLTLTYHPEYDPVVTTDGDDRLHWADRNYILVYSSSL